MGESLKTMLSPLRMRISSGGVRHMPFQEVCATGLRWMLHRLSSCNCRSLVLPCSPRRDDGEGEVVVSKF